MTKNRIKDLNDHMFLALERLNDPDLSEEVMDREIQRAKSIASLGANVTKAASLVLRASELQADGTLDPGQVPAVLSDRRALDGLPNSITKSAALVLRDSDMHSKKNAEG